MNDMKYLKYMYNSSEAQETVVNDVMMTNPLEDFTGNNWQENCSIWSGMEGACVAVKYLQPGFTIGKTPVRFTESSQKSFSVLQ